MTERIEPADLNRYLERAGITSATLQESRYHPVNNDHSRGHAATGDLSH